MTTIYKVGQTLTETIGIKTVKKYEILATKTVTEECLGNEEVTYITGKLLNKKGEPDKRTWSNTNQIIIWSGNKHRYTI